MQSPEQKILTNRIEYIAGLEAALKLIIEIAKLKSLDQLVSIAQSALDKNHRKG